MDKLGDPREALAAKDVTTRAAGARALALSGSWDDVALLVDHALHDKSPSVRLYTAAAAAEVVCRYRGLGGAPPLERAQRQQVMDWVKGGDPGFNPGLLLMLAAVPGKLCFDRLGRILRDPRRDVRLAVVAVVRRMVLSCLGLGDDALKARIISWLEDRRVSADVSYELIRMVGEAGWSEALPAVHSAVARAQAKRPDVPHGQVTDELIRRLAQRDEPQTWSGVWVSEGRDVLEGGAPTPGSICVVHDGYLHLQGASAAFSLSGQQLQAGDAYRLIWAPKLGDDSRCLALQSNTQTWWKVEDKPLGATLEARFEDLSPAAAAAARVLIGELEGVVARRARGLLTMQAGQQQEARDLLASLCTTKRPNAAVLYWLGWLQLELGDPAAARQTLTFYLTRAAKKAPKRAEAERLLASL